jgi:hypothetical protein
VKTGEELFDPRHACADPDRLQHLTDMNHFALQLNRSRTDRTSTCAY